MHACRPRAHAIKDFPHPHLPCMSRFSCLRINEQSDNAARSSAVKLRSVPHTMSSMKAVYLRRLVLMYISVFLSLRYCCSASAILAMANSSVGRFCTGSAIMASYDDAIPFSFRSLSCITVSWIFMTSASLRA